MKMSKVESAIRVALAFNEAVNRQDVANIIQLVSDDCVFETSTPAPDGTVYAGPEAISHFLQKFFHKYPQAHIKIEDIYGFGHRCNMHWRREWLDEAGQSQAIRGVTIFQEKNGVICEILSYVKS